MAYLPVPASMMPEGEHGWRYCGDGVSKLSSKPGRGSALAATIHLLVSRTDFENDDCKSSGGVVVR